MRCLLKCRPAVGGGYRPLFGGEYRLIALFVNRLHLVAYPFGEGCFAEFVECGPELLIGVDGVAGLEPGGHGPALDEGVTTVKQVNKSLEDVNRISAAASSTANNVGALTDLYGSFLGKPVIKIASFFYALKSTAQSFVAKKSTGRDSVEGSGQQESKAQ